MLLVSLEEFPTWAGPYRFLAACQAHLGHLAEAQETIDEIVATPSGNLEKIPSMAA